MGAIVVTRSSDLPVAIDDLVAYHDQPIAFERLSPPWRSVRLVERSGGIGEGARTAFRGRVGPVPFRWVAEHVAHEGAGFTDVMRSGPLAAWRHEHLFDAVAGGSRLTDQISATPMLDRLLPAFVRRRMERDVEAMLRYRHLITRDDLTDSSPGRLRIAITGASGLIGTRLRHRLRARGHNVVVLVRGAPGPDTIRWNPRGRWDASPLEGFDAVVHLAGESIGSRIRWNREAKARILGSRVDGTRSVASALAGLVHHPALLVSASAVGYYGDRSDEPLDETSSNGDGFLASVCRHWEEAADAARDAGIRVVHPRFGIAIAAGNGAVRPMSALASLGLLGPIGSGRQRVPWISLHDATRAIEHLITSALDGPVNVCVPEAPPQREVARALSHLKHRPSFIPAPAFAIRAALGEQGKELLLSGQGVVGSRLIEDGFRFSLPTLEDAFSAELGL